jgi:tetratricopeptide (TPR) repeat protein
MLGLVHREAAKLAPNEARNQQIGLLLVAFVLICAGCRERLDAEIHGYRAVLIDEGRRIAVFDPDRLPVIRVPGPKNAFDVEVGGENVSTRATYEEGANFLYVPATGAAGDVDLIVVAASGERARFEVRFTARPEDLSRIRPIAEARARGDFAEAMALAEEALEDGDPLVRVFASIERGRIAQRRGDQLEAARLWREGSEIARSAGVITEVSARLDAAAYAARAARRFAMAEELLELAEAAANHSGDLLNRFTVLTARAELASDLGDQRRALADHHEAAQIARRLGIDRLRWISGQALGNYLFRLGRFEEALAVYPDPEELRHIDADLRASFDVNIAWIEIRGIQAGVIEMGLASPRKRLERALPLLETQPYRFANALCTLARAELAAGELARAGALVEQAAERYPPIFTDDIHDCSFVEIEIDLASGRVEEADRALTALEQRLAKSAILDELALVPLWLRARIARARAQPDAVGRYFAAFDAAVALARQAPIQQDRAGFVQGRTTTVDELIDLLLERGDVAGAFSVADAARALVLSDLDAGVRLARLDGAARSEWSRLLEVYHSLRDEVSKLREGCEHLPSADVALCRSRLLDRRREVSAALDHAFELLDRRAPAPDVARVSTKEVARALHERSALLLVHGMKDRTRSFFIDAAGVRFERGPPPLERWVAGVEQLYVVGAWDPLEAGGALDAARVAVAMLPSARFLLEPKLTPKGRPLIAGDPNGDLPGARREAKSFGAGAVLLVGRAASRKSVLSSADGASFFHFAGHAKIVSESPWQSSLLVSDGTITLEDLLVARPKVGVAVLSACSSGGGATRGELGLPHAFLMSGARAVLATTRPLADAEAGPFLARFYQSRGPERPLEAFREAIAASQEASDLAWKAFRLFGR